MGLLYFTSCPDYAHGQFVSNLFRLLWIAGRNWKLKRRSVRNRRKNEKKRNIEKRLNATRESRQWKSLWHTSLFPGHPKKATCKKVQDESKEARGNLNHVFFHVYQFSGEMDTQQTMKNGDSDVKNIYQFLSIISNSCHGSLIFFHHFFQVRSGGRLRSSSILTMCTWVMAMHYI